MSIYCCCSERHVRNCYQSDVLNVCNLLGEMEGIYMNNKINQFDWVDFYKELSEKLLSYKDNRKELVAKVERIFSESGVNMPKLEKDNLIVDIDPFTVFGLFNKSSMKADTRVKIITTIKNIFGIAAPIPSSFASIPVLNNQNATFYYFIDMRGDRDIDDLWDLFESALAYVASPTSDKQDTLSKYFDLVIKKKGNGNSKITMGLYWIAPDTFLNLDQRNMWYIYESGKLPSSFVKTLPTIGTDKLTATEYFDITEKLRSYIQNDASDLNNFMELSSEAWHYSEQVNKEKRQEKHETIADPAADVDAQAVHYWIYSPGRSAEYWDEFCNSGIMGIGWDAIGDLKAFASKDDMKKKMKETFSYDTGDPDNSYRNAGLAVWQFANELKPGDIVFAKKGLHHICGRGIVTSDYEYDENRTPYKNVRKVNWTHNGDWLYKDRLHNKTLSDVTAYTETYVKQLNALFNEHGKDGNYKETETYRNEFSPMLIESKNLIFRGAPGTGKSYLAKEIAADIISNGKSTNYTELTEEQKKQVEFVQFHPSYDYSDFVEGLRPKLNDDGTMGFELQDGTFKRFIARARKNYEDSRKSKETIGRELSVQEAMMEFFSDIEFGVDTFKTITGNEFSITSVDDKHINISIPGNAIVNKLSLDVDEVRRMLEADVEFTKIKDITAFFGKSFATQSYSYDFAIYNAIKSKKTTASKAIAKQEELKKYIFIIDEINRGEISKIFGELFFAIDPDYRGRAGEISTQYANMHADSDEKFFIPENVYIIGTMNDIDKSVDSFDFAMRRRFRFVELKANERIKMLDSLEDEKLKNEAVRRMTDLNKAITEVEDLNENYQIGAAYFLKLKTLHPDTLWRDHLQPLLREYVRGIEDEESLMSKFAKAYDDYQDPNKDDADEDIKD